MASSDDFCLKWNDHHTTFFNAAEQLCQTDLLTDVTLSCGPKEFSAHKLVLSVCSGYFAQLFAPRHLAAARRQGGQGSYHDPRQAIVYLRDVDARHMELLLSYMYRGEINVQECELMGLLATAKSLQIKGLTDAEEDENEQNGGKMTPAKSSSRLPAPVAGPPAGKPGPAPAAAANNVPVNTPASAPPASPAVSASSSASRGRTRSKNPSSSTTPPTRTSKRHEAASAAEVVDLGEPEVKRIKEESFVSSAVNPNVSADPIAGPSTSNTGGGGGGGGNEEYGDDLDESNDFEDYGMEGGAGGGGGSGGDEFPVPEGGGPMIYEDQNDQNLSSAQIPYAPAGSALSLTCPLCGKFMKKRHWLRRHLMTHTGEKPYQCRTCSYAFGRRNDLKRHCVRQHDVQPEEFDRNPGGFMKDADLEGKPC